KLRVAELFAGVGGFRLGLEGAGMEVVWSNQWEPPGTPGRQFAWRCYEAHFGVGSCVNEDIEIVLDQLERGERDFPAFDLLCGGFPCQDYSVAVSGRSQGIQGRKGVLWWQIVRMLELKKPHYVLFENVDRLLKSPSSQKGRDFAIILNSLDQLGYRVEWRVVNAADYGFPQRRRRVFIFGERLPAFCNPEDLLLRSGVLARAFPAKAKGEVRSDISICGELAQISSSFGIGAKKSAFLEAGIMHNGHVSTVSVSSVYDGSTRVLGDVLLPDKDVPESYYVSDASLERWAYLKGAKKERRVCKRNGYAYTYSEGAVAFPDDPDKPSRTILTGEGGVSPSRFKHVIRASGGTLRRLTPVEVERLFGFPDNWTNTGMTDSQRTFCMGNALVVGLVRRIGKEVC
ncbi:MAG: DNA (cytosine-5-)-methyltransferase, partial [Kiritimatiellae bacterium]|nr:DNA (cytosine-5-)-methyltransferase [Kiritimatiellia bacterium]